MPRGEHTSSKRNLIFQNILRSLNAKRKKNKINDKDHQILLRQAQDILNYVYYLYVLLSAYIIYLDFIFLLSHICSFVIYIQVFYYHQYIDYQTY